MLSQAFVKNHGIWFSQARWLTLRALALALSSCLFHPLCAQEKQILVRDIFDAWKRREGKVTAAFVAWTEQVVTPKGTRDSRSGAKRGPMPEKDFTSQVQASLKIQKEFVRYERDGLEWFSTKGRFLPTHYITVYDGGGDSKAFWERKTGPAESASEPLRIGIEMEGRSIVNFFGFQVQAVLLALRPTDPQTGLKETDWEITQQGTLYEGRPCIELRNKNSSTFEDNCLVDPSLDYAVVRRMYSRNGKLQAQLDIAYQLDTDLGWFPKSWRYTVYANHVSGQLRLQEAVRAEVTEHKINPKFAAEDFHFDFPPATHVSVHPHSGKNQGIEVYVTTPEGKHPITPDEARRLNITTYEGAIQAALEPPRWGWRPLYGALILAGVVASSWFLYRVTKRARGNEMGNTSSPA